MHFELVANKCLFQAFECANVVLYKFYNWHQQDLGEVISSTHTEERGLAANFILLFSKLGFVWQFVNTKLAKISDLRNIRSQIYRVSDISGLRNIFSQKHRVSEISGIRNVGSQKCWVSEISCLRNIVSQKYRVSNYRVLE